MSDLAKTLGIDIDALIAQPKISASSGWPNIWRVAIETMFVAGYSAADINRELPNGPSVGSILSWAKDNNWVAKRSDFSAKLAETALKRIEESAADVTERHLKHLKLMQLAGMTAIANRSVSAKTLEGTITAVVTAMKVERQVRGLAGEEGQTINATSINLQSYGIDLDMIDRLPPEKRDKALELQRKQIELASELNALEAGDQTIEGTFNETIQDSTPDGNGHEQESPLPQVQ